VVDPTGDGSSTPLVTCKYPDTALRLCFEFDDGKVTDGSQYHLTATTSNVGMTNRDNGKAAAVYWESDLDVGESPMLDITQSITFETFLYINAYPPFGAYTFIRNEGQYGMSIDASGKLRCYIGTQSADTSLTSLTRDIWHHFACAYDGTKLRIYVDGNAAKCGDLTNAIPTAGTQGTRVVDNLTAYMDDVRIYARALSGAEICSHADKTGCSASCE